jgi:hypothetical protein
MPSKQIGVGIAGYKERTRLGSLRLSVLPDANSDPCFVGAILRSIIEEEETQTQEGSHWKKARRVKVERSKGDVSSRLLFAMEIDR